MGFGAVVLALTGAEALYADMGHFGRRPIQMAWLRLVLPALVLNYFGQGASLIRHPSALENPFFMLTPQWALLPLILLATMATVIASQAVISGAYSLTRQAIQFGFSPRMRILHTSVKEVGQIYLPFVNWALLVAVCVVILTFRSSTSLSAAYGIAVTGTMLISTILFSIVAHKSWNWSFPAVLYITMLFLVIDLTFFTANIFKVAHGGWLPLAIGLFIFTLLSTWRLGSAILDKRFAEHELSVNDFVENLNQFPLTRVQGTAVFLTGGGKGVPQALLHNLKHNKVLHERVVLLHISNEGDIPYVDNADKVEINELCPTVWSVVAHYGFMETPDLNEIMLLCAERGLVFEMLDTSFFISFTSLVPGKTHTGMARWRKYLYVWMDNNAMKTTDFFRIPTNRVVEMGA